MDTPPPHRPEPTSGSRQLRRTAPFQFLNSDDFAILFLIICLCFIFIVLISPFYSSSFHFFKPQFTRKSLDFLSLAMVLFAIACGFMSKNNEEIYRASSNAPSNDSEQIHKSNPSIPNQWNGYADRTDQILLHHPPSVAGVEYWRLSGGDYMADYRSLSSDSVQHCRNLKDFEDGFDFKRGFRGAFSVYDEEISSSSSALHQFSGPPLMTPPQPSSPPRAVVGAEVERTNEGDGDFEPLLLRLDFQALENELIKNEVKESKRNKNKNKMKKWQKGVGNFNDFLTPQHQHHRNSSPPAPVHHYRISSKIGETRRDFPVPPQLPRRKLIAVRTQNRTGGEPPLGALAPPSTAAEFEIKKKGENLGTRNENAESPDVNSKADSFIERFRAGLKLERMNSIKERRRKTRTSILGRQGPE